MAYSFSSKGKYLGYQTTVTITHNNTELKISTRRHFMVTYEVNSDTSSTPATSTVTLYNIAASNIAKIHKNDHIAIWTGPKDIFGKLTEGYITDIAPEALDGRDKTTVITFTEEVQTKNTKIYSTFNGAKMVTKKVKLADGKTVSYQVRQVKKVNITFPKKTHAKTIIERICRDANIPVDKIDLKKNYVYKKGYTVSAKPLSALASIVKICDTSLYQRRGKLVFDPGDKPNPYNENIYLGYATGLLTEPEYSASDKTYTATCMENPLVMAGSATWVRSHKIKKLLRVKSVTHTKDTSAYTMEVVWNE